MSGGNFNTYNPLNVAGGGGSSSYKGLEGLTGGDTTSGSTSWVGTTFALPSGKWYFEVRKSGATGGWPRVGFYGMGYGGDSLSHVQGETDNALSSIRFNQGDNTLSKYPFGSTSSSSVSGSIADGDILQVAIDVDAGKIWYGVNNTYLVSGDPANGNNPIDDYAEGTYNPVQVCVGTYNTPDLPDINFGQDSTFRGQRSAGGNTDGSFGDFAYAPPSGFLAICSANLPISDDIDPAQTDDDFPQKLFNAITWTGNRVYNSTVNNITGVGFQPDLVWLKFRDQTYDWRLVDSSRGVTKAIRSNKTTGEQTEANGIYQFDSDGFSVKGDNNYNYNGGAFIGYCWRANGGNVSSNSDGSITSSVQTSPAKNFSIITYSGNGSNSTIGHGMTKKPAFIVVKNLNDSDHWAIYHESMTADFYTAFTGSIFSNNATFWNDTEPTTSVISIGTNNRVNGSGDNFVCYAWSQVEGMQRFSTYQGNGNSNGSTILLGFRPRMIFIKKNANSSDFHNFDTARNTFNPVDTFVSWDSTTADDTASSNSIDFLSQGFKVRNNASGLNASGSTYVFGAWGDVSYKYNNTF